MTDILKMIILLSFSYSNLAQCQPSIIEHQTLRFTSEWEAAINRGIWTILPRWATEFREPTRGIWQNFSQKTVVHIYDYAHVEKIIIPGFSDVNILLLSRKHQGTQSGMMTVNTALSNVNQLQMATSPTYPNTLCQTMVFNSHVVHRIQWWKAFRKTILHFLQKYHSNLIVVPAAAAAATIVRFLYCIRIVGFNVPLDTL